MAIEIKSLVEAGSVVIAAITFIAGTIDRSARDK
jgi:hypothetical protein